MKGCFSISFSIIGSNDMKKSKIGDTRDSGAVADQKSRRVISRFVGDNRTWWDGTTCGKLFDF
jgi:hypothetical protein